MEFYVRQKDSMKKFVAGTYKHQYDYKSFTPTLVNRHFSWENPQIDVYLEKAGRLLGELNAYATLIPDIDFFIKMNVVKEATKSNLIEGTKTQFDEVILPEEEIDPERRHDWHEVQNYIQALHFAIDKLPEIPISTRLLRKTHKILLSDVRGEHRAPGEIRRSQNWIGGTRPGNAVFVPPTSAASSVPMRSVRRLCAGCHYDRTARLP